MLACPSPLTLARLGDDGLSSPVFVAIEAHVEDCPDCQAALERLAEEDRKAGRSPASGMPPEIPGFTIVRELGRGGMGIVYEADEPRLSRRVAIKVVLGGLGDGPAERRRWLREARSIAQVRHPNVVPIHGAGEQDGWPYLVLGLVPGGSLKDRVAGPVAPRSAATLVETVSRALAEVHEAGVLHLDIKPSNILLDGPPDGRWEDAAPMISDFGIARVEGDDPGATATALIAGRGTPSYMAPEQVAGDRAAIGPPTDIFAIGATLYTLLTGRPPFRGATVIETLDLVRAADPVPPGRLIAGISPDLQAIVLTCLRKDPRRRYATALDLADDLRRWLDGIPIRAREVSAIEHAARWCRRRPAIAALLGTLGLTVLASMVGLGTLWRRAEEARARAVVDEAISSRAVGDIVRFVTSTIESPHLLTKDRVTSTVRSVRDLTARLRKAPRISAANLVDLSRLELRLAWRFQRYGKFGEAKELLVDALDLLDVPGPQGGDLVVARTNVLITLGCAAVRADDNEDALAWFEVAARNFETMAREAPDPRSLGNIYESKQFVRSIRVAMGDPDGGRRVAEENLDLFQRLAKATDVPAACVYAALARLDLDNGPEALAGLRTAIARFGPEAALPEAVENALTTRIGDDIAPGFVATAIEAAPAEWAAKLIVAIEARGREMGVSLATTRGAGGVIGNVVSFAASARRRAGRLDDARCRAGRLDEARRMTACLLAYADALRRQAPDALETHVVASRAFEQAAKDGWEIHDYAAIERALIAALSEANLALQVAPDNEDARLRVAGLKERLVVVVTETGRDDHDRD